MEINGCPVCLREQAIEALINNPSEETRKALFELVGFESGLILSNIDLTKKGFCKAHSNFVSYRKFLLRLNSPDVVTLLLGTDATKISVN